MRKKNIIRVGYALRIPSFFNHSLAFRQIYRIWYVVNIKFLVVFFLFDSLCNRRIYIFDVIKRFSRYCFMYVWFALYIRTEENTHFWFIAAFFSQLRLQFKLYSLNLATKFYTFIRAFAVILPSIDQIFILKPANLHVSSCTTILFHFISFHLTMCGDA